MKLRFPITFYLSLGKLVYYFQYKNEIWSFPFEKNTKHPAPFPIDLPNNIMDCIPKKEYGNIIVLDPFMGSGTVALAALQHNFEYIGFEKFKIYVDMTNERIDDFSSVLI